MKNTWSVEVWKIPPGPERYRDAHPKHRERGIECGSVEVIGRVFQRTYQRKAAADKMAERWRKLKPEYHVNLNPGFTLSIDLDDLTADSAALNKFAQKFMPK